MRPSEDDLDVVVDLSTTLSAEELARVFSRAGWQTRRCTWVDWEVTCEGAELVIEATAPPVVHGHVARGADFRTLLAPLTAAGLAWDVEVRGR